MYKRKLYKRAICRVLAIMFFSLLIPYWITMCMSGVIEEKLDNTLAEGRRIILDDGSNVGITEYIIGAISAEWDDSYVIYPELIKLKAFMIRSNIYERMGSNMTIKKSDVGVEYVDIAQMKKAWGSSYEDFSTLLRDNVDATSGKTATSDGAVCRIESHSLSCGKTREGVTCNDDLQCEQFLSVTEVDNEQFAKKLLNSKYKIKIDKDNIREMLQIAERDAAGYVVQIKVDKTVLSGKEFAKLMNLKSPCMYIEYESGKLKITTKGIGDGFGISMYTAQRMVSKGSTYLDIISFFYKNVVIAEE